MKKLSYFLMVAFLFAAVACNIAPKEVEEVVEETEVVVEMEVEETAEEVVVE